MGAGQLDFNHSSGCFLVKPPLENERKTQWFWILLDTFIWENTSKTDVDFPEEDGHSE